jgi:hypothetical protein
LGPFTIGLILVAALLVVASWFAGHRSGALRQRQWADELLQTNSELAATKLAYQAEKARLQVATSALQTSGKQSVANLEQHLRSQLLRSQADAEACKEIVDRQQLSLVSRLSMIGTLSQRGVKLLPMTGADSAAISVAYLVLIPNAKVIFVGSGLPELPDDRQLQMWILRKQSPEIVSAGLFSLNGRTAVLQFSNAALVTGIESIAVTEEPLGGSPLPTGPKLLVATIPAVTEAQP